MKVKNETLFDVSQIPSSDIDFGERPKYRPFSFYVLGGIDVDGDALNMDAPTSFDDDESSSGIDCVADATSDPRISPFDIVERAGVSAYEKYKAEAATSRQKAEESKDNNNE